MARTVRHRGLALIVVVVVIVACSPAPASNPPSAPSMQATFAATP